MSRTSEPGREIEALRERSSALTAFIARISASLDLETVLREIAQAARALTGAHHAVITTVDASGQLEDAVSDGLTPEQLSQLTEWSDNMRSCETLRDLHSPLPVADIPGHIGALGDSANGVIIKTCQGTPLRHRGEQVGNLFLGEKETGSEFTAADEEVLALFASQAAAAIANARAHRDERRARADLEALVEASPVGVAVFDARSGLPVSFNCEARRIVEGLVQADRPAEELLEVVTCRFADGRETALDELPLARALRAEEITLSVPDGPSVTALLTVAPIRGDGGEVVWVVVSLQDLEPLQELVRMRSEFLGMVSHELREPLTSIRGSAATLLEEGEALDSAERREFFRIIVDRANQMRGLISDLLDAGQIGAGTLTVLPEPVEVAELVEPARTTFQSGGGRHAILVDLPAGLPRVLADRRRIVQVLGNLISNAARHAPESSPIRVGAAREQAYVAVSVFDEGPGVAPEQLPQLFRKHPGGEEGATAGHGLGLAICKGLVEAHGGRIRADSAGPGRGTTFTFTIPAAAESGGTATVRADAPSPEAASRDEPPRILVVDDDPQTLRFIREELSRAGYAPLVTGDSDKLAHLIRSERPQLVLLDLLLPGSDGIELMRQVPELADQPVIFISVYGRDETVARALESGAADYIVKPFSPTELVARIRAAVRRHAKPQPFVVGELAIDFERRWVTVGGEAVDLTATEFELLRVLSLHAGSVVTYEALLRRIWSKHEHPDANLVRIFVRSLRHKLGDSAASPAYLFNERGVGYRMPLPSAPSSGAGTPLPRAEPRRGQ